VLGKKSKPHHHDILIVGAGIAGTEAALACAKAGLDTLLVTTILDSSYNLFSETTLTPPENSFMAQAVEGIGTPVRPWELHRAAKYALEHTRHLHSLQSNVSGLMTEDNHVTGVTTWEGVPRFAKRTALCVGSFLEARLTLGSLTEHAGRLSEMAYDDLYLDLLKRRFRFRSLELEAKHLQPTYKVLCKVFDGEIDKQTFESHRLKNLYAAGLCAFGEMSYEEVAEQGLMLARVLNP
jgi:tRNA U34 5-carboxymethylaminomethyl modifying enzyme MnmG/GidA